MIETFEVKCELIIALFKKLVSRILEFILRKTKFTTEYVFSCWLLIITIEKQSESNIFLGIITCNLV